MLVNGISYPGGGGALNKILYGEVSPEVQPLSLSYTNLDKKGTPFRIPFIDKFKWYHILVQNTASLLTSVNTPSTLLNMSKSLNQKCFTAIKFAC